MINWDDVHADNDDEFLRKAECTLEAQIDCCVGLAGAAFEHIRRMPNTTALAGVSRVVDLLDSFFSDAERLKDQGRSAVFERLSAIRKDIADARATWARTLGVLVAADLVDADRLVNHRNAIAKLQKDAHDQRLKQGQAQANDTGKLL